jgi:hypothetical protein
MYDYVVIGGGPTGLTLAWYLAKHNKTVLVIEREATLGGCHRVSRVVENREQSEEGYFTEHGPRIYETSYRNFINLLTDMGTDFYDLFVPYKYTRTSAGRQSLSHFSPRETILLASQFARLLINPRAGAETTVYEFMTQHNFSSASIDYADRLCRLTDGADATRYTLLEFLQLVNQRALYQIYQPRQANDRALFAVMRQALELTGRVTILTGTEVKSLVSNELVRSGPKVSGDGLKIVGLNLSTGPMPVTGTVLVAIPPVHLYALLQRSFDNSGSFIPIDIQIKRELDDVFIPESYASFKQWVEETKYLTYLPVSFHWHEKLDLPKLWGFASTSSWGIVWNVLSDYFDPAEPLSKTLISSCVTRPEAKSEFTGRSANESTEEEIIAESFRQLSQSFAQAGKALPAPDRAFLSPEFSKNRTPDSAFVLTPAGFLPAQSRLFSNLYSVGTHNGKSPIDFTSMESAVANAIATVHQLIPESRKTIRIESPVMLTDVIKALLLIIILWLIL